MRQRSTGSTVLRLRYYFVLFFTDGVNTATVPSPSSEEAAEISKDQGRRPFPISENDSGFVYEGDKSVPASKFNSP